MSSYIETGIYNLTEADTNKEYVIRGIESEDNELKSFLFTLGCFPGELITVVSDFKDNFVISVKDARYSIDSDLAKAIIL